MSCDSIWRMEAFKSARKAGAVNPLEIIKILESQDVSINDLDDVCEQYFHDFPCLFYARFRRAYNVKDNYHNRTY